MLVKSMLVPLVDATVVPETITVPLAVPLNVGLAIAGDVRLSGAFNPFCPIVLIAITFLQALLCERLVR